MPPSPQNLTEVFPEALEEEDVSAQTLSLRDQGSPASERSLRLVVPGVLGSHFL